jgi:cell division protein FtsL
MVHVFGVLLAVLLAVSFIMLALFVVTGVVVSVLTLLRAHRERQLAEDLDEVLVEIVGPRSGSFAGPARPYHSRH